MLDDCRKRLALTLAVPKWPPTLVAACLLCALATAAKPPADAWASPLVISDNRLAYLDGFPALGRGYNVHDNSVQAQCFTEVQDSVTTLDFNYAVLEINEDYFRAENLSESERQQRVRLHGFLRRHAAAVDAEMTAQNARRAGAIATPSASPSANASPPWRTYALQISSDRYDYVLNEARSKLSESVQGFLKTGRFVTFFRTCGHYYIRSVRAFSSYVGLLQFKAMGDPALDQDFVDRIEGFLVRFKHGLATAPVDTRDRDREFEAEATARDLRLFVHASGLGTATSMPLLPTSIAQLHEAVERAARVMRLDGPGVVTEVEVVPWFDNPTVSALLGNSIDKDANAFRRVHTVEVNARVVSVLTHHRDRLDDELYLAKSCLRTLDEHYPGDAAHADNTDARRIDLAATVVLPQLESGGEPPLEPITVAALRAYLIAQLDDKLATKRRRFLNGDIGANDANDAGAGGANTGGALACLAQLRADTDQLRGFDEIPACEGALTRSRDEDRLLANYCVPLPAVLASAPKRKK